MIRVVTLPSGRRVTLAAFVAGWKRARLIAAADPDFVIPNAYGDGFSRPVRLVLADFRRGMHNRINAAIPYTERGR